MSRKKINIFDKYKIIRHSALLRIEKKQFQDIFKLLVLDHWLFSNDQSGKLLLCIVRPDLESTKRRILTTQKFEFFKCRTLS